MRPFVLSRLVWVILSVLCMHFFLVGGGGLWIQDFSSMAAPLPQTFAVRTVSPPPAPPTTPAKILTKKTPQGTENRNPFTASRAHAPDSTAMPRGEATETTPEAPPNPTPATPPEPPATHFPSAPQGYTTQEWVPPDRVEAQAFLWPTAMQMDYVVKAPWGLTGAAVLQWSPAADASYQLRFDGEIPGLGNIRMLSTGALGPSGMEPQRYSFTRRGNEQAAHFRRDRNLITFSNNRPDAPLLPGAQDFASAIIYTSSLLAGSAPSYPEGSLIRVQVASRSKASVWNFTVMGQENIHPPAGPLEALKVRVQAADHLEYLMELWLAPSLQYLPARIRITGKSLYADALLRIPPLTPLPPISH